MSSKILGKHLNYKNISTYHSNICNFSLSYELIWISVCCNFSQRRQNNNSKQQHHHQHRQHQHHQQRRFGEICFINLQERTSFVGRGDAASVFRVRNCAPEPIRSAHPTTSDVFAKRSIPANSPVSSLPFAIPFRSIYVSAPSFALRTFLVPI